MTAYMISYDLKTPGKDYDELTEHIKTYPLWWHYLGSTWIVESSLTAVQIRDACKAHLDSNDRLIVTAVGASAWTGFPDKASVWLKNNL